MKDVFHNTSLNSVESHQSSDSGTKRLVAAEEQKRTSASLVGLPLAQLDLGKYKQLNNFQNMQLKLKE